MFVQTPKRPILPPTPSHSRPCLPPLSSLLNSLVKLPSIADVYRGPYPTPSTSGVQTPTSTSKNEADTSILESKKRKSEDKAYAFISHSPATFPSQEPLIDNAPLARRKRRRTSPNELSILNAEFEIGSTPNKLRRLEISKKVNMTEKAIQIWFQNKRQSLRKQSSQEKEVTELLPVPPSTHIAQPTMVPMVNPVLVPSTPLGIVSSTPVKPQIVKSHSYDGPTPTKAADTLIQDPDSLVDDSILVLNETRKKQPTFLNSTTTSTMTFKLMPNNSSKVKEKLAAINDKENQPAVTKVETKQEPRERQPLGEISANKPKEGVVVQNLLSLRSGSWS